MGENKSLGLYRYGRPSRERLLTGGLRRWLAFAEGGIFSRLARLLLACAARAL